MRILALEFSSPQRSVAVVSVPEGGTLRRPQAKSEVLPQGGTKSETGRRPAEFAPPNLPVLGATSAVSVSEVIETTAGNTMKPLGMVKEALEQAGLEREQIECLVIGIGPGSYTGIRAALSLAQGWQLARGVKLLGISSAECVAAQAQADGIRGRVDVVIDAQRKEFYLAGYELDADGWRETAPLRLADLREARDLEQGGGILAGPEVARWFPNGRAIFPRAAVLGKLALTRNNFSAGEKLEPIYLRKAEFVKAATGRPAAAAAR
jgi:tRNA threonylcarbamoyl adenosine modification protein YeaZ